MTDEPTQPVSPTPRNRRSSFAGQTFADLFGAGRRSTSSENVVPQAAQPQQMPGPISKAAAQAQQRRLSLTTLGLSGSPNQSNPFRPGRRGSIGSANSSSIDESAVAEDDAAPAPPADPNSSSSPTTPFARRTSFGAKALRDIRTGSFGSQGGGGSPGQNGSSEGFNWGENLRNRAERTSMTGQAGTSPPSNHSRAKSVAVMEPPPAAPPKPKEKPRPDHFQERILKGDFYMD